MKKGGATVYYYNKMKTGMLRKVGKQQKISVTYIFLFVFDAFFVVLI